MRRDPRPPSLRRSRASARRYAPPLVALLAAFAFCGTRVVGSEAQPPAKATSATTAPPATAQKATASPKAVRPEQKTTLDVLVQDPAGKPVEGALVTATGWSLEFPPRHQSGRTSVDGRVRLTGLARPPWTVGVQARGLAPKRIERVAGGAPFQVRMETGSVVTGIVRDAATRDPVAGADVWVLVGGATLAVDRWNPDAGRVAVRSDAKGRFRLDGLGRAPMTVQAAAAGVGRASRSNVRPGEDVELFLLAGATIAGTVRDAAGKPVAKAVVRVLGDVPSGPSAWPPAEQTDAAGRYAFVGLDAGSYTVVAREGPRAPAFAHLAVDAREEARADLVLEAGGFVTGRLVDGADRPLAGRIRVAGANGRTLHLVLYDLMQTDAGADGRFSLGPVPAGALEVQAVAPGLAPRTVEAEVDAASRTADLGDVVLETGLTVRGVVRDRQGAGIADASVTVSAQRGPMPTWPVQATTNADGTFVLGGVTAGTLVVTARAPGYASARETVAPGADNVELVLDAGGTVVGSAVDARGQAIEGPRVTAEPEERELQSGAMATDEGGGRFAIRDLAPGRYVLEARAAGHVPGTVSGVRVVAGRTTDVGVVRLRSGGVVRGTVVDGSGTAVTGATVAALAVSSWSPDARAETDGSGAFEIAGVPAGRVSLFARHPSYVPAKVEGLEITAEGASVETRIVMTRGGRVEGVVRRRNGQGFAGARVVFASPERGYERIETSVHDDGSFVAEHVPAGAGSLHVLAPGSTGMGIAQFQTVLERPIQVVEGETATVDVTTSEVVVTGQVTRRGEPVPGVTVLLSLERGLSAGASGFGGVRSESGPQPLMGTTREDGTFELLVFEPGRYRALMRGADGGMRPLRDASRPPDQPPSTTLEIPDVPVHTVSFAVPGSTLAGVVVAEDTGNAIAQASVMFGSKTGSGLGRTGSDGRFSVDIDAGEGRLRVSAPDFATVERPLTVPDAGVSDLRIEMARGLVITGRVEDAAGRPLGREMILCWTGEPAQGGSVAFAQTLPDGTFRLTGLSEAVYVIAAGSEKEGYGLRSGVRAGAAEVVVSIRPPATVRVRVVDAAAQPVAKAVVRVSEIGGMPARLPGRMAGTTDEAGQVELVVPEGSCTLESQADRRTGRAAIEVRPGASVSAEIVLSEQQKAPTQ